MYTAIRHTVLTIFINGQFDSEITSDTTEIDCASSLTEIEDAIIERSIEMEESYERRGYSVESRVCENGVVLTSTRDDTRLRVQRIDAFLYTHTRPYLY